MPFQWQLCCKPPRTQSEMLPVVQVSQLNLPLRHQGYRCKHLECAGLRKHYKGSMPVIEDVKLEKVLPNSKSCDNEGNRLHVDDNIIRGDYQTDFRGLGGGRKFK